MLATGKELLRKDFNIVIDTAFDGPDTKEMSRFYLNYLRDFEIKFVGIYCQLEERLKRLKIRTGNLFLTEDFIKIQERLFDDCNGLYDIEFDSSKMNCEEIASETLQLI